MINGDDYLIKDRTDGCFEVIYVPTGDIMLTTQRVSFSTLSRLIEEHEDRLVEVADLYVKCSLQVRNFNLRGVAMSDCCGTLALTAVQMENGAIYWRCRDHEGMRSAYPLITRGPIVRKIPRFNDELTL